MRMTTGEQDERYAARFPGWRPTYRRQYCPRWVVGKRCTRGLARGECECDGLAWPLWDHVTSWLIPGGGKVLTVEPYNVPTYCMEELRAVCTLLGIELIIEPGAPYGNGTTLIVLRKAAS